MTEWKRDIPWRQGHLLTSEAARALGLQHTPALEDTLIVVASHDCDLVQPPDLEPTVEVIVGRRIPKLDGNHTHAKSPRTLHIAFEGQTPCTAEFVATNKHSVDKQTLLQFDPDGALALLPRNRHVFQRWLAARYRRAAFPDEFLVRMGTSGMGERIKKATRRYGEMIVGIFFDVDEGRELSKSGPDDTYLLDIILLHASEPDFTAAEQAAHELSTSITGTFQDKLLDQNSGRWTQIELRHVDVVSEESLTFGAYKNLNQWRCEHISLGADPQQPMTPE